VCVFYFGYMCTVCVCLWQMCKGVQKMHLKPSISDVCVYVYVSVCVCVCCGYMCVGCVLCVLCVCVCMCAEVCRLFHTQCGSE